MIITKELFYNTDSLYFSNIKKNVYERLQTFDKSKTSCSNENYYEFFLNCYNKNLNFSASRVDLVCGFCGNTFNTSLSDLLCKTNSKYGFSRLNCKDSKCLAQHKRFVIEQQFLLGKTSAKGHIVSKDQIRRMIETGKTSEKVKRQHENRTGKSIEEYYGEEVAKKTREKLIIAASLRSKEPHAGFKNTKEAKDLMSRKRIIFLKNNPNYSKELGKTISNSYWSKPEEYRVNRRKKHALNLEKQFRTRKNSWNYHKAWWQSNEDKDQSYQSFNELAYYKQLDIEKIFYKTNHSILIPYMSPLDNEKHFYIPDVQIYDSNWNLKKLVEVKPYWFVYCEVEHETMYAKITKAKLISLKNYCYNNNLEYEIITEKDLNFENIKN